MVRSFERDTNPAVVASIPGPEVSSEHTDIPLIAVEESDENILGRALACAAWAKESKDFVRFDSEGQIANGGALGARIREAERMNVDNGHCAGTLTAMASCHGMLQPQRGQVARALNSRDAMSARGAAPSRTSGDM